MSPSSACWLTPQQATMASAGLDRSLEPETPPGSPPGVTEIPRSKSVKAAELEPVLQHGMPAAQQPHPMLVPPIFYTSS